jgi:GH24 family phage-related lysozyme (muramidase)
MKDSIRLALLLIKEFEGCKLEAYPDPGTGGAPWTIGWGTTTYPSNDAPVRRGDRITQAQANTYLHMRVARDEVNLRGRIPTWAQMNDQQQAALLSFSYNVGANWFGSEGFRTITDRVRNSKWPEVPAALMLYVNPGSSVEAGLRRRRAAEGKLFASGPVPPAAQTPAPAGTPRAPVWPSHLVGPKKRPQDCGFKPGDTHLIVNDHTEKMDAYNSSGNRMWQISCLARGQGSDYVWSETNTDTPPGLYKIGQIYNDIARVGPNPSWDRTLAAYGWLFFDMVELEGQERRYGRAGIGLHGGGTALGWPAAWAPYQGLVPTLGCLRIHNIELRDKILPLTKQGTVFISVLQEAPRQQ